MVQFDIVPVKSALLIIDMINAMVSSESPMEIPNAWSIVPNLKKLIQVCRTKGALNVFVTRAYRANCLDQGLRAAFSRVKGTNLLEGTWEVQFYGELQPEKSDVVITKRRYSAFIGTDLDLVLRSNGIDTVIIGGVATNGSPESTAREAALRDYKVIFLSDGTVALPRNDVGWGSFSQEEVQRFVLTNIATTFGQILSIDEVINKLH